MNNKVLNNLDKFVLGFIEILKKHSDYVIVSGYVSIFFGRSRATEDIDILIRKKDIKKLFGELLKKGYWLINATSVNGALELLSENIAVRISVKDEIIPNIELKYPKMDIEKYSLENRTKVKFDGEELYFSELELQIVYKFVLGSGKDIEDALHLFQIFSENLDKDKIRKYSNILKVKNKIRKYLGEDYV